MAIGFNTRAQFGRKYEDGAFYNLDGKKIIGQLFFSPALKYIGYRTDKNGKKEKINIDLIKAVIAGKKQDSLVVMTEEGKTDKKYFAKPIVSNPSINIFCKFRFERRGGGVPTMSTGVTSNIGARGSAPSFRNTYSWSTSKGYLGLKKVYMYELDGTTYEIEKDNFIDILTKAFPADAELAKQLQEKKIKFRDLDEVFERNIMGAP
jgi:hypothetical protein